jgi:hypothetical protein
MATKEFSVMCQVCHKQVNSFTQVTKFILMPKEAVQELEIMELACGCAIDFPDWQIDMNSGVCRIYNFAGTLYISFLSEDMILEEEDE